MRPLDTALAADETVQCLDGEAAAMDIFIVDLANRPGELARVTEAVAGKGVNIEFVAPAGLGDTATIALGVSDEDAARAAMGEG